MTVKDARKELNNLQNDLLFLVGQKTFYSDRILSNDVEQFENLKEIKRIDSKIRDIEDYLVYLESQQFEVNSNKIVRVLQSRRRENLAREDIKGLTPDGSKWIIEALDGFHDRDIGHRGYPDMSSSKSVVQECKIQFQIAAPAVAVGGNWDCQITALNELCYSFDEQGSGYGSPSQGLLQFTGNIYGIAPFIISTNIAGSDTMPGNYSATFSTATWQGVNFNQFLENGPVRCIGQSFEVHNTTAEINKQGTCTVYKMPQNKTLNFWNFQRGGPILEYPIWTSNMPPINASSALLLSGSRQWDASEGCLVNCCMNDMSNPFCEPANFGHWYSTVSSLPTGIPPITEISAAIGSLSKYSTDGQSFAAQSLPTPFDTSGAFFSGLSNATTLTVTFKLLLEVTPEAETDLVTVAQPSAAYDPDALKLYALCIRELPPGVKVADNASGDWFRGILGVIRDVAPAFGPLGSVIGNAAGNLAKNSGGVGDKTSFIPKGKRVPMRVKY